MARTKPFAGGELTVRETAERLDVDLQWVYKLIWGKKLKCRRHDGRWVISKASVRAREKEAFEKEKERNARK